MSEDDKKPKLKLPSRFVARAEDIEFVTPEEADAWVKQRRAELEAFGEKRRQEAEEQRKREQEQPEREQHQEGQGAEDGE